RISFHEQVTQMYEDCDIEQDIIDDQENLLRQVEACAAEPDTEILDSDQVEEMGGRSTDPSYVFCPAPHRLAILRLFAKHHSWHPLLKERHGQTRSAEDMYRDAVTEMYTHCTRNNLYEIWAYMWNSWYSPAKWKLWAHSAYPDAIPRKRTTMMVEAGWKNLKRTSLRFNNRPRMDYVVHVITRQCLPLYRAAFANTTGLLRDTRTQNLTAEQRALKKSWEGLRYKPVTGNYDTDIVKWLCNCGAQKYNANLLCKHLVQAVPLPSNYWWPIALRSRIPPFYDLKATKLPSVEAYSWTSRMPGVPPPLAIAKTNQGAPETPHFP
ncbi:MAG TPA: hypothetical protein VGO47_09535, partial [Chlamydiales bacterium]|nr:hypothetical protein [Chlamydiales bacterium]